MKKLCDYYEDVNGFVIDLTTDDCVFTELSVVLHNKADREDVKKTMTIPEIREFILAYYIDTYCDDYIILKQKNVYQIIFKELYIND